MTPRQNLEAAIAEKDRLRGRPLTAYEKLRNLSRALYGDDRMLPAPKQEPNDA